MAMEPHNCRTVSIRAVMPPKPAKKAGVPIPESLLADLMAKDAKAVRARFRKKWGPMNYQASGEEANAARKQEADAKRDALAEKALTMLDVRQMSSTELMAALEVSENQMRNALGLLRASGRADFARAAGGRTVWHRTQEAAE